MTPTPDSDIQAALADLPGWSHEGNALAREYACDDFESAIAFIVRIGFHAARLDHHPELFNVYSTVRIRLTTHDAGDRVTQRDLDLARAIAPLSSAFCSRST
jgi:4a-hydroxytetrahydrobiopterin dehydratase